MSLYCCQKKVSYMDNIYHEKYQHMKFQNVFPFSSIFPWTFRSTLIEWQIYLHATHWECSNERERDPCFWSYSCGDSRWIAKINSDDKRCEEIKMWSWGREKWQMGRKYFSKSSSFWKLKISVMFSRNTRRATILNFQAATFLKRKKMQLSLVFYLSIYPPNQQINM